MNLSESDRNAIIDGYVNVVTRISDIEYQKRVWIKGEGPECDDFDETVCQFFDISDPLLSNFKNFNFSQQQLTLLKEFSNDFRKFSEKNYLPEEFIDSPDWKKIIQSAQKVLQSI